MYNQLESVLGEVTFSECQTFIKRVRDARHKSILECQKVKYNRLWQKNQVAAQKVELSIIANTCLYHTVDTETLHHLTTGHLCPSQKHQQQQ